MKKLFLLFVIFLFSINLISADECTPEPGYNRCFFSYGTQTNGNCIATAVAKVQGHTILVENGRQIGEYVTGKAYIDYKFDGKYFGLFENREWDYIWDQDYCSKNGCSINFDKVLSKSGRYYLTNGVGTSYNKYPRFIVWEHVLVEKSNCWAWKSKGHGWGYNSPLNLKQIECYEDYDCSSGYACDKSGSWENWKCGKQVRFKITATNTGDVTISNMKIENTYPSELKNYFPSTLQNLGKGQLKELWISNQILVTLLSEYPSPFSINISGEDPFGGKVYKEKKFEISPSYDRVIIK